MYTTILPVLPNLNKPIENLKDFISDTKLFDFVQGHQFAAGLGIKKENNKKAIDKINELLKDVEMCLWYYLFCGVLMHLIKPERIFPTSSV